MAIESYLRACGMYLDDVGRIMECHPGLEMREGDNLPEMNEDLMDMAREAAQEGYPSHEAVSGLMLSWILSNYPDRAYFVETEMTGTGVQVYDPRDFVKERCPCHEHL